MSSLAAHAVLINVTTVCLLCISEHRAHVQLQESVTLSWYCGRVPDLAHCTVAVSRGA